MAAGRGGVEIFDSEPQARDRPGARARVIDGRLQVSSHEDVHANDVFRYSKVFSIAGSGVATIRVRADQDFHAKFRVAASAALKVEAYENPQFSAIGLYGVARNSDRGAASTEIFEAQRVIDPGATFTTGRLLLSEIVIDEYEIPEWIFDPRNTASRFYAINLTDLSTSTNNASISASYYYE